MLRQERCLSLLGAYVLFVIVSLLGLPSMSRDGRDASCITVVQVLVGTLSLLL